MDPISSLTTFASRPRGLKLRGEDTNCARLSSRHSPAPPHPSSTQNPLLPLPAPLLDFRPRQLASTLFLNLSLRLLQMERRLLPSSRERHRAP